jgi:Ser/Thr protein kinase RdoA (MazF antagonist)
MRLQAKDAEAFTHIRTILERYHVGQPVAFERFPHGVSNISTKITTEEGIFVLKQYRRTISEELQFEQSIMEYLRSKGVPVPEIMVTKDFEKFVRLDNVLFGLYRYIEGETFSGKIHEIRLTGELLAEVQKHLKHCNPKGARTTLPDRPVPPDILLKRKIVELKNFEALKPLLKNDPLLGSHYQFLSEEIDALHSDLFQGKYTERDVTLMHYDFHPHNLLFKGHRLTGLLDFDYCHYGLRQDEVASALFAMICHEPTPNREAIITFIHSFFSCSSPFLFLPEDTLLFMKLRLLSDIIYGIHIAHNIIESQEEFVIHFREFTSMRIGQLIWLNTYEKEILSYLPRIL